MAVQKEESSAKLSSIHHGRMKRLMATVRWLYQTELVTGDARLDQMLRHRGEQGWELVTILPKKRLGPPIGSNP